MKEKFMINQEIYGDSIGLYFVEYSQQGIPKKVYCNLNGEKIIYLDKIGLYFIQGDIEGKLTKIYCDEKGNRLEDNTPKSQKKKNLWRKIKSIQLVPNKIEGKKAYLHVLWVVLMNFCLTLLIWLVHGNINGGELTENEKLLNQDLQQDFIFTTIMIIVIAPIYEELFFRGILFGVVGKFLSYVMGRWAYLITLVLSTSIFILAHGDLLTGIIAYGLPSLIFTYAYYKTGRIGVAIASHALHNLLVHVETVLTLQI